MLSDLKISQLVTNYFYFVAFDFIDLNYWWHHGNTGKYDLLKIWLLQITNWDIMQRGKKEKKEKTHETYIHLICQIFNYNCISDWERYKSTGILIFLLKISFFCYRTSCFPLVLDLIHTIDQPPLICTVFLFWSIFFSRHVFPCAPCETRELVS